mgnify:CR=1 FL=1
MTPEIPTRIRDFLAGSRFAVAGVSRSRQQPANAILRSHGDTKSPAVLLSLVAVVNIAVGYVVIFGLGPVPGLGTEEGWASPMQPRTFTAVYRASDSIPDHWHHYTPCR